MFLKTLDPYASYELYYMALWLFGAGKIDLIFFQSIFPKKSYFLPKFQILKVKHEVVSKSKNEHTLTFYLLETVSFVQSSYRLLLRMPMILDKYFKSRNDVFKAVKNFQRPLKARRVIDETLLFGSIFGC